MWGYDFIAIMDLIQNCLCSICLLLVILIVAWAWSVFRKFTKEGDNNDTNGESEDTKEETGI